MFVKKPSTFKKKRKKEEERFSFLLEKNIGNQMLSQL